MDVPDQLIEQLKHEIANLKAMLEPLESGRVRTGTKRPGEPWTYTTQAWIDHRILGQMRGRSGLNP